MIWKGSVRWSIYQMGTSLIQVTVYNNLDLIGSRLYSPRSQSFKSCRSVFKHQFSSLIHVQLKHYLPSVGFIFLTKDGSAIDAGHGRTSTNPGQALNTGRVGTCANQRVAAVVTLIYSPFKQKSLFPLRWVQLPRLLWFSSRAGYLPGGFHSQSEIRVCFWSRCTRGGWD